MAITTFQVDSGLGRWTASKWRPAHLAGVVEFFWHFDGTLVMPRERVFPSGRLELIVQLDATYRLIEGSGPESCPWTCLTGLQTSSMLIEAPARSSRVMGIRFHPIGAYAVLGLPLSEVSGLTVDLQDLAGRAAAELTERCHGAATVEERFRLAAEWIAERAARSPVADPAVSWIARQIERQEGAVSIAELREQAGMTRTRLAAAFREQIGVAPKLYARILRFRRLLGMLHEGAGPLSDLALAAGYYDQPHMNAEFRELSGLTPREFLAGQRFVDSVSLAEQAS
ncbi:MAG TPA: AraC family transcriptional regulator [Thermoanaerobaculia bacterium]|nr:AraC family transcriptional regulator [Thermoanaerobaculia bacterium]